MDLRDLTKDELQEVFLSVNTRYLSSTNRPIKAYINDVDFIKIRNELGEVLDELQRRRKLGML